MTEAAPDPWHRLKNGEAPKSLYGDAHGQRLLAELSREVRELDLAHLKDIWWHDAEERDPRGFAIEPDTLFDGRVREFRAWLSARPETLIAVVGHGTFFYHLTGEQLPNCGVVALEL